MAQNKPGRTTAKKTPAQKAAATRKANAAAKKAAPRSKATLTAEKRLADKAKDLGIDQAIADASNMEVSTADSWQGRRAAVKMLLPSGNVVKVINKGLMAFVQAGKIPNVLMPLVMQGIREGKGLPPEKLAETLEASPEMLKDMFLMQGTVVRECVQEPRFHIPPYVKDEEGELVLEEGLPIVDEDAKEPGRLYLDDMDFMDKNFIFQWVMGGTKDLERFRDEQTAYVAGLSPGGDVGAEA